MGTIATRDTIVAVITGASSGIGEEFARQLHEQGATVVLVARRLERLEALAATFNQARPNSARVFRCDLASQEISLLEQYLQTNRVDLLLCNAGKGSFGRFEKLSRDGEEELVRLNAIAPLRLMHAVVPQMKERRRGTIISVASIAGFQPLPYMSTYAATKSFNLVHLIGLRHELKEFGITLHCLCPGPTETEFGGVARVPGEWTGGHRDSVTQVVRDCLRAVSRKQAWVTPGIRSKALCLLSRVIPMDWSTRVARYTLTGALKVSEDKK